MVKEARELARGGALGILLKVVAEYSQGWLLRPIDAEGQKGAAWRTDPQQAGASSCIGDTGTHADGLLPGNYVSPNAAVAELVDNDSFYVVGYFEETKLPHIRIGDPVSVQVMGEKTSMRSHVEGLAAGIQDGARESSATMLANVNPIVSWVRLAQRVPVRIAIDDVPENLALISRPHRDRAGLSSQPVRAPEARVNYR